MSVFPRTPVVGRRAPRTASPRPARVPAAAAEPATPRRCAAASAASATNAALAAALLTAGGLLAWSVALQTAVLRGVPIAALVVLIVARRLPARLVAPLLPAWLIAAPVVAGLPLAVLKPSAWPTTSTALTDAAHQLSTSGATTTTTGWPLALALGVSGTVWLVGAALATSRRTPVRVVAFLVLAVPLAAATALQGDAAWRGALIAAAAMLWLLPGRRAIAGGGILAVCAAALAVTSAVQPEGRWLVAPASASAAYDSLDTEQTYGPLQGKRKGRVMFEITADRPGLWGAQVLESFDGTGWRLSLQGSHLPQPKATTTTSTVTIRGLRDDLVAAPGTIDSVSRSAGRTRPALGGSRRLKEKTTAGETYRVRSSVVDVTEAQLAAVPFASNREAYRSLAYGGYDFYRFGDRWGHVADLARSLTQNAKTPLEAVRAVQSYLRDSGTFTYTTDVPTAPHDPILDFLLVSHRGYCQQFAGAAAMLLRIAGIPTRVVVGYATGERIGTHRYAVRDTDAHAWIEVYFEGVGWVPFNPTPGSADAEVDAAATLLAPATVAGPSNGGGDAIVAGGVIALFALGGTGWTVRGRRRARRLGRGATAGAGGADDAAAAVLARGLERVAGPLPAARTLAQLRGELATRIGPHTAALAAEAERSRFAPEPGRTPRHPRRALWRALRADVGARRAARLLLPL